MRQEITIIVTIDIEAALTQGTLDNNIYLTDNLRTEGSVGECSDDLISILNGAHWADGSQADEQLLNWLPTGVGMLSPTMPMSYFTPQPTAAVSKDIDEAGAKLSSEKPSANALADAHAKLTKAAESVGVTGKIKNPDGSIQDTGMKLVDIYGKPVTDTAAAAKAGRVSPLNYMTPQISNISGEAVEKGILYPAQYGTPVAVKNGWYWSATASTYVPGTYAYTMHITLYKPTVEKGSIVWEPVYMTHDAHVKVTRVAKNNAFTGGGMAILPII